MLVLAPAQAPARRASWCTAIAYLIRARRQPAGGILALAYNRHAAVEIRRRLRDLVGQDAHGVTVLTYHALAMRFGRRQFPRAWRSSRTTWTRYSGTS